MVPVAPGVTITVPSVPFAVSRFRSKTFLHQPPILENDASQYCDCRTQHARDVDCHAQRVSDDAYDQSPFRACTAPTFHIWSK